MKQYINLFLSAALLLVLAVGCKKEENRVIFLGGTAPVLKATVAENSAIPLSFANANAQAIRFSWSNPDYMFNTGISSQDVSYALEIDTTGANFTNPNKAVVSISRDMNITMTQSELNALLLNQLVLVPGIPHNLEVRVKSTLGNGALPLYSNTMKFKVTPYAIPPKVVPPASGKLFITGGATPASWMGGGDPELASQRFRQVSNTLYVLDNIALSAGGSFLFVPQYGDWSAKYGGVGGNNSNNVNGDDFVPNGSDLLAPPAAGNYKIEVDFQRGKYTLTKL